MEKDYKYLDFLSKKLKIYSHQPRLLEDHLNAKYTTGYNINDLDLLAELWELEAKQDKEEILQLTELHKYLVKKGKNPTLRKETKPYSLHLLDENKKYWYSLSVEHNGFFCVKHRTNVNVMFNSNFVDSKHYSAKAKHYINKFCGN